LPSSERGIESESSKDRDKEDEGIVFKDEMGMKEKKERRRMTKAFTRQIYEASVDTPSKPRMEPESSTVPTGRRRRASEGNKRVTVATKENSPQKNVAI
jgi:hypothetical protein